MHLQYEAHVVRRAATSRMRIADVGPTQGATNFFQMHVFTVSDLQQSTWLSWFEQKVFTDRPQFVSIEDAQNTDVVCVECLIHSVVTCVYYSNALIFLFFILFYISRAEDASVMVQSRAALQRMFARLWQQRAPWEIDPA